MRAMQKERWIPTGYEPITRPGIDAVVYVKDLSAMAFKGKAVKHSWYYSFRNAHEMNDTIDRFFSGVKSHQDVKQKRKEERSNFRTTLKPGDILYTSWGWEQTNTEFFQVIAVRNNTVTLREIGANVTETGFMCGYAIPIRSAFIDGKPEITRRVTPGYRGQDQVKIDNVRYAWFEPTREKYHISWYG